MGTFSASSTPLQEIHPSGQGRIDSVKINPSLLSMKEWFVQPWGFKFHFCQIRIFPQIGIFLSLKLAIFSNLYFLLQICIFLSFYQFTCHSSLLLPTLHLYNRILSTVLTNIARIVNAVQCNS